MHHIIFIVLLCIMHAYIDQSDIPIAHGLGIFSGANGATSTPSLIVSLPTAPMLNSSFSHSFAGP